MKEKKNIPILVANTEWELPENLLRDVKAERMINGLLDMACPNAKMDYKDLVGWAELVAYLMPATSQAPLQSDVAEIYLYCVSQYMKGNKKEVPPEIEVKELSEYQMQRLDEYRKWIFKTRGGKESNPILNALKEAFFSKSTLQANLKDNE